jgi:alanyl-tRNA synthetase
MSTEKLYDISAYQCEFEAIVLSCAPNGDGTFSVILNRTAFFPNEGGQKSDHGTLAGVEVLDVNLKDGIITHTTSAPLGVGNTVIGKIDFEERFEKMQCHTAEHIVCGLVHSHYGFENVGFHLSDFDVIFDFDGVLNREQLDFMEDLANRAVTDNLPVTAFYPTPDELATMAYRAKLDLKEGVRIVKIGDVDTCACCAPHVKTTGEIGQIRILEFEKHRGGTRIRLLAGRRALIENRRVYRENYAVACALSVTQYETYSAVKKLEGEISNLKYKLSEQIKREMSLRAQMFSPTQKHPILVFSDTDMDALRAFANQATEKCEGILVLVLGDAESRKVLLSSKNVALRSILPLLKEKLSFRGGGSDVMMTGSTTSTQEEIDAFFDTL